jgi:hypothetical protein
MLASGSAPAVGADLFDAFIAPTSETVSSSIGQGFTRVPGLKPAQAGTQVMASESGSGWIIYCGCDVEIKPGRVYTVEDRPCKVESVDSRQSRLPHIVNDTGGRGEQRLRRCRRALWWALGGAGAAVGACAAGGCFDDDPPVPASN